MATKLVNENQQLSAKFKVWLCSEDGQSVFGDGRLYLLEAIDQTGSIVAAAEKLGISYRKAWDVLSKAEKRLGVALLAKRRGGASGGQTSLTEAGRTLMKAYAKFRANVEEYVSRAWDAQMREFHAEL